MTFDFYPLTKTSPDNTTEDDNNKQHPITVPGGYRTRPYVHRKNGPKECGIISKESTTSISNLLGEALSYDEKRDEKKPKPDKILSGAPDRQPSKSTQKAKLERTQTVLKPTKYYNYSGNTTCPRETYHRRRDFIWEAKRQQNTQRSSEKTNNAREELPTQGQKKDQLVSKFPTSITDKNCVRSYYARNSYDRRHNQSKIPPH